MDKRQLIIDAVENGVKVRATVSVQGYGQEGVDFVFNDPKEAGKWLTEWIQDVKKPCKCK